MTVVNASNRIRGVLAPVVTPFNADWSVNSRQLLKHCESLVADGAGLALFGTNSEATSVPMRERKRCLEQLLESGIPADRLMPGTGCCSLEETVELTRHAVGLGVRSVLMLPPYYYKEADAEGLLAYFGTVIERSGPGVSVYLYNIPQYTQVPITSELVDGLLDRFPQAVAGLKDSSGDWSNTARMLERFAGRGFDVFCASEAFLSDALSLGAAGCISATANVNARGIRSVIERAGTPAAASAQLAATQVRNIFQSRPMISAMKHVLSLRYDDESWQALKPPLSRLSADKSHALMQELSQIRFG